MSENHINPTSPTLDILLDQYEDISGPETYGPEGTSILVALWRKSKKLGWKLSFQMTNTELQFQTGIKSRDTINSHRTRLVDAGLIGYVPPPRGKARGDYRITLNLLEPVRESDNLDDNFSETVGKPVQKPDNLEQETAEPVRESDHFADTVLKDFKDLISSSFSSSAQEIDESIFKERFQAIKNHFVQKRNLGLEINVDDEKAIREIVLDGLPVELVNSTIDACFQKYKPKHKYDLIRTFTYCVPSIYDVWTKERAITEPVALGSSSITEPVALGGPITENAPSEPVALGSTRSKSKQARQFDALEQFIREEKEREQIRDRGDPDENKTPVSGLPSARQT